MSQHDDLARPLPRALRRAGSTPRDDDPGEGSADVLLSEAVAMLSPLAVASHEYEVGERVWTSVCDDVRTVHSGALADVAARLVVTLHDALLACGMSTATSAQLSSVADVAGCGVPPTGVMVGIGEALADALVVGSGDLTGRRRALTAALSGALALFELADPSAR